VSHSRFQAVNMHV